MWTPASTTSTTDNGAYATKPLGIGIEGQCTWGHKVDIIKATLTTDQKDP